MTFELPHDFVKGTLRAKPILMYRVNPKNSVSYVVALNDPPGDENIPPDKIYENMRNIKGSKYTMHEPISGDAFIANSQNTIDFRVVDGRAVFSDVVIFYQRDIG